jgi:hypothetical protein
LFSGTTQDCDNNTMAEESKRALNEIPETNEKRETSSGRLPSRVESSKGIGTIAVAALNSSPKQQSNGLLRLEVRTFDADCRMLQLLTLTRREKRLMHSRITIALDLSMATF